MELEQCITNRRSMRRFQKTPVQYEDIVAMVDAARWAPSWKNSQVTRYYAVLQEDRKNQIAQSMPAFNQIACLEAPLLLVACAKKARSGYNRDGSFATNKEKGWQMYDVGLSNMLLSLKAYELGLGTVIMGYYDEQVVAQAIDLADDQEVVAVIAVGYADEMPEAPKRKNVEELLVIK